MTAGNKTQKERPLNYFLATVGGIVVEVISNFIDKCNFCNNMLSYGAIPI